MGELAASNHIFSSVDTRNVCACSISMWDRVQCLCVCLCVNMYLLTKCVHVHALVCMCVCFWICLIVSFVEMFMMCSHTCF